MQFSLIEAAVSCGSPTWGTEQAYQTLMRGGLQDLFPDSISYPMEHLAPSENDPPHLRHLNTVVEVSRRLRSAVLDSLDRQLFPLIVGGDHSISMGSLAALGEFYGAENMAVVYIDAHSDINTERTSVSGCIHGMDLAAACGLCCDELTIGRQKVNLYGKNLHILGGRSIDPPEYDIMRQQSVRLHSAAELRQRGLDTVLSELCLQLQGKCVHISLDVDSMDPSEFSSTGYLIDGGLRREDVKQILRCVLSTGRCVSFECVEYNPLLDQDGRDKATMLDFFSTVKDSLADCI